MKLFGLTDFLIAFLKDVKKREEKGERPRKREGRMEKRPILFSQIGLCKELF